MAISFRFSSFDIRLFSFFRKDENNADSAENEVDPLINFNSDLTNIPFEAINDSMMLNGLQTSIQDLEKKPVDTVTDKSVTTETTEVSKENTESNSRRSSSSSHNENAMDEVTRTIRYKLLQQFREYKKEYSVNFQYDVSRADTQFNEIYLNKHLRDIQQHLTEENRNAEKQKDTSEKSEQIRAELRKQDVNK